jgi:hypothetical protein
MSKGSRFSRLAILSSCRSEFSIHEAVLTRKDPALQNYADYDQMHVRYTCGSVSGFYYGHKQHAMAITRYLENQILNIPRKVPGQDGDHWVRLEELTNLEFVVYVNGKVP